MMSTDNHTDNLFRQLKDLEALPSSRVWQGIEERLDKKKRSLVPLLWRWGMAASILLAIGLFWFMDSGQDFTDNMEMISSEHTGGNLTTPFLRDETTIETDALSIETDGEHAHGEKLKSGSDKKEMPALAVADVDDKVTETVDGVVSSSGLSPNESSLFLQHQEENDDHSFQKLASQTFNTNVFISPATSLKRMDDSSENDLFANNRFEIEANQRSFDQRFTVGGEYSPTYAFRDVSGSVPSSGSESGLMMSGGGFSVALQVNSRWQIETGVKYAMMGQEVATVTSSDNVYSLARAPGRSGVEIKKVQLTNSLGMIQPEVSPVNKDQHRVFRSSGNELVELRDRDVMPTASPLLEQRLGYVQVPVTLRYKLFSQARIDVSVAGGLSTNWLVDNDAWLRMPEQNQRIGQTEGLTESAFSTHAGVTVGIPIYQGFRFRMEPRVDYFITDISEDSPVHFRPYSFGIFTGLFYEW